MLTEPVVEPLRILVCGCRDWTDKKAIFEALKKVAPEGKARNLQVVHGGCRTGADAIVHALMKGNCEVHPADWEKHGKAAGPRRNQKMGRAYAWLSGMGCPGAQKT